MSAEKTSKTPRRAKIVTEAPRQKRARRNAGPVLSGEKSSPQRPKETAAGGSKGPSGKLGVVVALMRRPEGATVAQMGEATGWQPHSVRGALAGALKRKHKLAIVGEPGASGRVYRIAAEQSA